MNPLHICRIVVVLQRDLQSCSVFMIKSPRCSMLPEDILDIRGNKKLETRSPSRSLLLLLAIILFIYF